MKHSTSHESVFQLSNIIIYYQQLLATNPIKYSIYGRDKIDDVELIKYKMASQVWSPEKLVPPQTWFHNLDIYIPTIPKPKYALIIINSGGRYNYKNFLPDFNKEMLLDIAKKTNTIVISINNIVNSYVLSNDDNKFLNENDQQYDLIARNWALFMNNPERRVLPLDIPMTAVVSQTIRFTKQELKKWNINKFIVSGVSARGCTVWLAAIANPDIAAIVPFANDGLNTNKMLKHVYRSYGKNWPFAFLPFYNQKIDQMIGSFHFLKLMQIVDPLQYLNSDHQNRLSIPKYIINASSDDFYTPDNSRFYYDKLPGTKSLRIIPNTNHINILAFTVPSLISFINRLNRNVPLPKLSTCINKNKLTVHFSEKPVKITRWIAKNSVARDFRYSCGIRYLPSSIKIGKGENITVAMNSKIMGWQATYIEAIFSDGYVATTEVYITPDEKFPITAPPAKNSSCQTLPGRI
ncbi:MAG TPA: PhoPQ-activated protein PqaA family protein [Arsenophonus nasoniae]|uniref:PhoPQ-activated protein PqaA family protein n=1 Tax=Arsenophonus nasoniae TaxID=638 RepID=UPI003879F00A